MARNIRPVLSSLACHKRKKETRLKSYIGACCNDALFLTSNMETILSISNLPYLNSQFHFQRLPGVLPVLFHLSQHLALLTIIEPRTYVHPLTIFFCLKIENQSLWQWTFNIIKWTCKFIHTNSNSRKLVQWKQMHFSIVA